MAEARFPTPGEREKRSKLVELLELGKVMIGVDATRPGVDLPPHLMGRPVVRLALSRLFRLDVFETGPFEVRANLSFGGERYLCVVPWAAIFQMTSEASEEDDVLFPDALSPRVLQMFATVLQRRLDEAARTPGSGAQETGPGDGRSRGDGRREDSADDEGSDGDASDDEASHSELGDEDYSDFDDGEDESLPGDKSPSASPRPGPRGTRGDDDTDPPPPRRPHLRLIH
jgi:hypothetical protein